ncbi:hypothetical protein MMU07_08825 [Aquiflexum sp. LQ15W]|uniref:hypothetical protein n=1 Tax=Cognataquiflexum nitidum TaxID=2922272 RepID=UPI001F14157D|nr:hypothetical protein [Cognataquiflexum nitidum]MCH6199681.1 hypothetical protein [Cognataquiflexum nitidum]
MKSISLSLFLIFIFFWSNAQTNPRISYRENFFGNHVYLANGEKVKVSEIEKIMAVFPEEAELFSKAKQKMFIGESLRLGGWILAAGSVVYLFSGDFTQQRVLISGGIMLGAATITTIAFPMKRNGKRETSNAIEIYNYKAIRGIGYRSTLHFKLSPLAAGLSLNF